MANSSIFQLLQVSILFLLATLILSPVFVPNTVLAGAGGIVTFSDGSTIDATNSSSYVGTPLSFFGDIARNGGWGAVKGVNGYGGRHILCLTGQACSTIDLSSYIVLGLGSLTFAVASWYMALGIIFLVLLVIDMSFIILSFTGKRKRRKR